MATGGQRASPKCHRTTSSSPSPRLPKGTIALSAHDRTAAAPPKRPILIQTSCEHGNLSWSPRATRSQAWLALRCESRRLHHRSRAQASSLQAGLLWPPPSTHGRSAVATHQAGFPPRAGELPGPLRGSCDNPCATRNYCMNCWCSAGCRDLPAQIQRANLLVVRGGRRRRPESRFPCGISLFPKLLFQLYNNNNNNIIFTCA